VRILARRTESPHPIEVTSRILVVQYVVVGIVAVLFIVLIALAVRITTIKTQERIAKFASWAASRGFKNHDLPGVPKWYGKLGPTAPEPMVEKFRSTFTSPTATCTRCYTGRVRNRDVQFFEYWYVVSTGKSSHTVYHALAVIPVNPRTPAFTIRKQGMWDNIKGLFGSNDLTIGDQDFDRHFYLASSDEMFLKRLLDSLTKSLIREHDATLWRCIDGHLIGSIPHIMTPENMEPHLDSTVRLAEALDRVVR